MSEIAYCGRCRKQKEKCFRIEPNSLFVPDGSFPAEVSPAITCKECLTDDEAARLLSPIALFVIERLFMHRLADAAQVRAVLKYQAGPQSVDYRERALEAL